MMMESLERSCSKPTCDTSMPSMSMRPPHFSVRRNSADTNDDLPKTRRNNIFVLRYFIEFLALRSNYARVVKVKPRLPETEM